MVVDSAAVDSYGPLATLVFSSPRLSFDLLVDYGLKFPRVLPR